MSFDYLDCLGWDLYLGNLVWHFERRFVLILRIVLSHWIGLTFFFWGGGWGSEGPGYCSYLYWGIFGNLFFVILFGYLFL